jgi:WD40 repeat protein
MPGGALLETNNTLEHPTGPEYQLVVGEGTYILRDDMHLATPPPHPSDAPQPNNNPLAITKSPPTAGTKLSTVVFAPKNPPQSQSLFRALTAQSARSNFHSIQEESHASKSDAGSSINGYGSTQNPGSKATFGDGNPALLPVAVKGKKKDERPKPKNNIVKSNSSFVSRVIPHESMAKRLAEHQADGIFAFANVNRAFMWLDLSAPSDMKTENMTKVLFTKAHALCHDVNKFTQSSSHIDVILGFNTGDIIWYEPVSQKYARINKNGIINNNPVIAISWLPNKENLFLAAHADGSLIVYDKEKEDAEFVPEEPSVSPPENHYLPDGRMDCDTVQRSRFRIQKSVQSRNQKTNPVSVWKLGAHEINGISFSPDGRHLAAVSSNFTLTIMDYLAERVLDIHNAYFSKLYTVAWSPDGRYILTGGEDELISIWSVADHALVARCVGHASFVADVKFDPWRCDERNYRFGSVGWDCKLLLWDFSVGMLGRPKIGQHRPSLTNGAPLGREKSHATSLAGRMRSKSNLSTQPDESVNGAGATDGGQARVHGVDSKASTVTLPPVMSMQADKHPLSWLEFHENCIITACDNGEFERLLCVVTLLLTFLSQHMCVSGRGLKKVLVTILSQGHSGRECIVDHRRSFQRLLLTRSVASIWLAHLENWTLVQERRGSRRLVYNIRVYTTCSHPWKCNTIISSKIQQNNKITSYG